MPTKPKKKPARFAAGILYRLEVRGAAIAVLDVRTGRLIELVKVFRPTIPEFGLN